MTLLHQNWVRNDMTASEPAANSMEASGNQHNFPKTSREFDGEVENDITVSELVFPHLYFLSVTWFNLQLQHQKLIPLKLISYIIPNCSWNYQIKTDTLPLGQNFFA